MWGDILAPAPESPIFGQAGVTVRDLCKLLGNGDTAIQKALDGNISEVAFDLVLLQQTCRVLYDLFGWHNPDAGILPAIPDTLLDHLAETPGAAAKAMVLTRKEGTSQGGSFHIFLRHGWHMSGIKSWAEALGKLTGRAVHMREVKAWEDGSSVPPRDVIVAALRLGPPFPEVERLEKELTR
jgi:hypothetical protein